MPYVTVPEQVELTPYIENHIKVDAGTNWNLANTAVATPIAVLPEPEIKIDNTLPSLEGRLRYPAQAHIPFEDPVGSVEFKKNSFTNQKGIKAAVTALEKVGHAGWIVVGNASSTERNTDKLAQKRAQAVANEILKQAKGPVRVDYFGPVDTTGFGTARTVEIFPDK